MKIIEGSRVAAIFRVSHLNQAKVKHGSIVQQENAVKDFLNILSRDSGKKLKLTKIFKERGSAKKGTMVKRKVIQELLQMMRNGEIDLIIFEKLDRFSRDQIGTLEFLEEAEKLGVVIYDMEYGEINMKDKNCRFIIQMKTFQNQEYSLELSEKMDRKQKMAMVYSGKDNSTRNCLGLDKIEGASGFYKINEDEVKIVIDIMTKFIQFQSYKETINYCNEMGYKTKAGKEFNLRRIQRLFNDSKLSGENQFEDTWNQFPERQRDGQQVRWFYKHGRVIEEELLAKLKLTMQLLNKVKKHKPGKDGKVSLLSGLLKTPEGHNFYRESAGKYVYYFNSETKIRLRMDEVEKKVLDDIQNVMLESGELRKQVERTILSGDSVVNRINDRLGMVEREIREKTKILDGFSKKMQQLVLSDGEGIAEACEFMISEKNKVSRSVDILMEEKGELEHKRAHVKQVVDDKAAEKWIKKTMASFSKEPSVRKKAILSTIFQEIVYENEKLIYKVNLDPDGVEVSNRMSGKKKESFGSYSEKIPLEENFGIRSKWRERRDSNSRPSP